MKYTISALPCKKLCIVLGKAQRLLVALFLLFPLNHLLISSSSAVYKFMHCAGKSSKATSGTLLAFSSQSSAQFHLVQQFTNVAFFPCSI
jgi:hypothetical protein